jgi:hypothetical protein
MHEYEIRVLKPDGSASLIFELVHLSDHAALRAARKLAEGNPFEVWRGLYCVYGTKDQVLPIRPQLATAQPK